LGSLFLFFFSLKFFSARDSFFVVVLFLLFPSVFEFSGLSYLDVPLSLFTVCFFYFFFFTEGFLRYAGSVFSLTLATLMKYQSMIYMGGFFAFYLVYILYNQAQSKNSTTLLGKGSAFYNVLRSSVVIFFFSFLLILPWLNFSLLKMGMIQRISYEALTRYGRASSITWFFYFFRQVIIETRGVFLLIFLPLFIKKKKENDPRALFPALYIYIFSSLLLATILFSNQQLRYVIHIIAFVAVLSIAGLRDLLALVKRQSLFLIIFIIIAAGLVVADVALTRRNLEEWGSHNGELDAFFSRQTRPYALFSIKSLGESSIVPVSYYFSSDQVMFSAFKDITYENKDTYPVIGFDATVSEGYEDIFLDQLIGYAKDTSVHVVFFMTDYHTARGQKFSSRLERNGFSRTNLTYYVILSKEVARGNESPGFLFPNFIRGNFAIRKAKNAANAEAVGEYDNALSLFEASIEEDPFNPATRFEMSRLLNELGKTAARSNNEEIALILFNESLIYYPSNVEIRRNLEITRAKYAKKLFEKGMVNDSLSQFLESYQSGLLPEEQQQQARENIHKIYILLNEPSLAGQFIALERKDTMNELIP